MRLKLFSILLIVFLFSSVSYGARVQSTGDVETKTIAGRVSALVFANPLAVDMDTATVFTVTVTGDTTVNASNGRAGQWVFFRITDDGAGPHTVTFGTNFDAQGTLTTVASDVHNVMFTYDGTNWHEESRMPVDGIVFDLATNVGGTANQVTVTDNGDGTVTLSTPQNTDTAATVTFSSVTSALLAKGNGVFDVKAYSATGDGSTDDRANINTAHTAATASGGVLYFPGGSNSTYRLSSNISFDSDVTLAFGPGAKLSVDNTFTATVNGTIAAGLYQIFSGAGSVTITSASVVQVYPQWWGALADGSNDDSTAINAAITATSGGRIWLAQGVYNVETAIALNVTGTTLAGAGWKETRIKAVGGVNGIEVDSAYCRIADLQVFAETAQNGNGYGIQVDGVVRTKIERCIISTTGADGFFERGIFVDNAAYITRITGCYLRNNTTGVYLDNGGAGDGPNFTVIAETDIIAGATSIDVQAGSPILITENEIESWTTRGIDVGAGRIFVSPGNHFEEGATGIEAIRLNSGVDRCIIRKGKIDYLGRKWVTDESGELYNHIEPYQIVFGDDAISGTKSNAYGAKMGLATNTAETAMTTFTIEAWNDNLILAASATGAFVNVRDDLVADGWIQSPFGGFGERAENNCLYSEDQNDAQWVKSNSSITNNDGVAPNGETTADLITPSTSAGRTQNTLYGGATIAASTRVTLSIWVRSDDPPAAGNFRIQLRRGASPEDSATPTVTTTWQRVKVSDTFSSGPATIGFRIEPDTSGGNKAVQVWGAQCVIAGDDAFYPYLKTTDALIDVDTPALVAADGLVVGGNAVVMGDTSIGTDSPETTSQVQIDLVGTKNILIDGRTDPRNMTMGIERIEHTPIIPDTRAFHFDVEANGQGDTHGIFMALHADSLVAGEDMMGLEASLDKSDSTGGVMEGLRVSTGGAGLAEAHALHADAGVDVIHQESGSFGAIEQAWDENGGFTDVTVAFNSTVTDVTIFSANADMVHIGDAADFNAIEVNLDTFASGAGVKPTYEYSIAGPLWTTFVPASDGTNGFRTSGTIAWDESTFSSWVAVIVNGVSKKYIRITRTQVGLSTAPIEDTIQVVETDEYTWNSTGDVSVNSLTASGNIKGVTKHLIFNVFGPNAIQAADNEVCIWPVIDDALTVTSVTVTLDAAGNEVAGDVKWADAFIGLATATVINTFDTTSGVLVDTTITAGAVAAGKSLYLSFDSAPDAAITQMIIDVEYDYD